MAQLGRRVALHAGAMQKISRLAEALASSGGFVKVYFDEALTWDRVEETISSALLSSRFREQLERMRGKPEVLS